MSNTIEEALAWLHKATGETWTPRELLRRVLLASRSLQTRSGRFGLPIKAAPPIDTKFGAYRLDRGNGTPSTPFVRQFGMPWQTIPLWPPQIEQLFDCGETTASVAEEPEDDYGQPDRYILIEPLHESIRITLPMVRIPDDVLRVLATITNATTRTSDERSAAEVHSIAPAPDPSNVPTPSADGGNKPPEDREERNARIVGLHDELRKKKVRNFIKVLAAEYALSESTIKKIVRRHYDRARAVASPGSNWTVHRSGKKHTRT
ncbi:hypothetical protein ISI02_24660 [Burkholderia pseudomallei]|nr:hypothetical protein [Burkholderia pseudomallei]